MKMIKVTGYIPVGMLEPDELDLAHETGLSSHGHESLVDEGGLTLADLRDVECKLVDE